VIVTLLKLSRSDRRLSTYMSCLVSISMMPPSSSLNDDLDSRAETGNDGGCSCGSPTRTTVMSPDPPESLFSWVSLLILVRSAFCQCQM
jgi:hypothetical protein